MATSAQILANRQNAAASTGPKTEAGKSASAANSTRLGLFTQRDFVRAEERQLWLDLQTELLRQLRPVGALEETFAAEIVSANWRLRRCGIVEAALNHAADANEAGSVGTDSQGAEFVHATCLSVDRARSQATRLLTRSMSQLKSLQNERQLRQDALPGQDCSELGLASLRTYSNDITNHSRNQVRNQAFDLEYRFQSFDLQSLYMMQTSRQQRAASQSSDSAERTQSDLASITMGA